MQRIAPPHASLHGRCKWGCTTLSTMAEQCASEFSASLNSHTTCLLRCHHAVHSARPTQHPTSMLHMHSYTPS